MESEPVRYATQIDLENGNDSHVLMIRLVGGGKRVLDVGCWTGEMGIHFAARNRTVVGIEQDETAAKVAQSRLSRVVVGDVEDLDLAEAFGDETFDVIVFGDVLEHLAEPVVVLDRFRSLLSPGGSVVASIPNVAHGAVRLRLLGGEFAYTDVGLLDRTHLRFFTRKSMQELFEDAGYAIVDTQVTIISPLAAPDLPIELASVDPDVVERVLADPDAHVYQYVVRAVPDDAAHAIRGLYRRLREQTGALERLRARPARGPAESPLVHLAVADAGLGPVARWSVELLGHELERRLPGRTVVATVGTGDRTQLRWADALISLVSDEGADSPSAPDQITLDVGPGATGGIVVEGTEAPLFGVALLAPRSLKEFGGADRLPLLRLTGVAPVGTYVVVAVDPGEVDDVPGLATVLERISRRTDGVVVIPLQPGNSTPIEQLFASPGSPSFTLCPDDAPGEDVLALLDAAVAVVTTHPEVAAIARSLERPHALLRHGGAAATVLAAVGGGVAQTVSDIESTIYRTSDLVAHAPRLAAAQGRIDHRLDEVAAGLESLVPASGTPIACDPQYVALLELTVARLQDRLASERVALAKTFAVIESERLLDAAGSTVRSVMDSDLAVLRRTNETFRLAIADLQEQLHAATRPIPAPPPTPITVRSLAKRGLRRMGLRRR